MNTAREVVTSGIRSALELRSQWGVARTAAISAIDFAESLGITVRLVALPSLEALYIPDGPHIVLGSQRPQGRRAFSCAHEIGHHALNHGFTVDELVAKSHSSGDLHELAADSFAGALLMPKVAVLNAFHVRGWNATAPHPNEVYTVACFFGVGYATLVNHMAYSLRLVRRDRAAFLLKSKVQVVRTKLTHSTQARGLLVVDNHWGARPADVEVGDYVLLPSDADISDGNAIEHTATPGLVVASRVGSETACLDGRTITIRVAKPAFTGLAIYRFLEEENDDSSARL